MSNDLKVKFNFGQLEIILKNLIELQYKNIQENKFSSIPYIQGSPGIGKSEWMKSFVKKLSYDEKSILNGKNFAIEIKYLSTFALEKLTGLPTPEYSNDGNNKNNKFTLWTIPDLFKFDNLYNYDKNKDNIILLFLDDAHLISKIMQPYLFQFYSYRSLQGYTLPKNVIIIAAGNGPEDNSNYQPVPAAVINRYKYIYMENDLDYWKKNYGYKHVNEEILIYLDMNPDKFYIPAKGQDPFTTPRSWSSLSDQIENHKKLYGNIKDEKMLLSYSIGTIDHETAVDFTNFVMNIFKYDGLKYLKGSEYPKFNDMKQLDKISLMISVMQYYMKYIREINKKYNGKFENDKDYKIYTDNFIKIFEDFIDYLTPIGVIILHKILNDQTLPESVINKIVDQFLENDKIKNDLMEALSI